MTEALEYLIITGFVYTCLVYVKFNFYFYAPLFIVVVLFQISIYIFLRYIQTKVQEVVFYIELNINNLLYKKLTKYN